MGITSTHCWHRVCYSSEGLGNAGFKITCTTIRFFFNLSAYKFQRSHYFDFVTLPEIVCTATIFHFLKRMLHTSLVHKLHTIYMVELALFPPYKFTRHSSWYF